MRLETIIKEISEDPRNEEFTQRGILPILQVDPQAKICIIGQAPGRQVEQNGIPFHDKSGQTLMEWMGISASIFYSKQIAIVPMDFYYPGKGKTGDLPPRPWVADTYHKKLFADMPSVEMTILVGKYAMAHYLHHSMKKNLTETVRSFRISTFVFSYRASESIELSLATKESMVQTRCTTGITYKNR